MLKGKNIFVIQDNNKILASTVTNPVTVFSFTNRNIAHRVLKSLQTNTFTIYPTMINSYVVNINNYQNNNDIIHKSTYSPRLDISEMSSVYLGLLCNLNNVNAVLVNNVYQTSDSSILLRCNEDESLPSVFTNQQMIVGNLEKLILKDD